MNPVNNIWDTLCERRVARSFPSSQMMREKILMPERISAEWSPAVRPRPDDREIDRAIMLLDAAAAQARLAAMQANDPSCSGRVEAQIATIVELLGLARDVTSRLE